MISGFSANADFITFVNYAMDQTFNRFRAILYFAICTTIHRIYSTGDTGRSCTKHLLL